MSVLYAELALPDPAVREAFQEDPRIFFVDECTRWHYMSCNILGAAALCARARVEGDIQMAAKKTKTKRAKKPAAKKAGKVAKKRTAKKTGRKKASKKA
jgi:hypothetical protein